MSSEITININTCGSGKNTKVNIFEKEKTPLAGFFADGVAIPPSQEDFFTSSRARNEISPPPLPHAIETEGVVSFILPPDAAAIQADSETVELPSGFSAPFGDDLVLPPFPPDEKLSNGESHEGDIPPPVKD